MFEQVFQGRVEDGGALRDRLDLWVRDHGYEAEGWLGTTAGVTTDGEFIAVVRFDSQDAAKRNSDRPEQGQWWSETEQHFAGPVQFHDYPHTAPFLGGGSDDAGFVQVIQGHSSDAERVVVRDRELTEQLAELRPEIIGASYGWDDQGHMTQIVYFTSEAEARAGERKMQDAPGDLLSAYEKSMELLDDVRYLDLADPWMWSPQ